MTISRRTLLAAVSTTVGLAATGALTPVARAARRSAAPPTAAELAQSGADQQRWLSVPESRIVVNPFDFGGNGTELEQNSGPELPLSVGYYAHDRAARITDLLTVFRANGDRPSWTPPETTLSEDFSSVDDWSPAGVAADSSTTPGLTTLTVTADQGYGHIARRITVDLERTPMVSVTVPATTGTWSLKVNDGTLTDDLKLQADTGATGSFTYDLRAISGWSGTKEVELRVFAVGNGKSVTLDSLTVHAVPAFPDADETVAVADEFDSTAPWSSSSNGTTITSNGAQATVTLPGSGFGYVGRQVTVDVTAAPVLSVRVLATTGAWALKINTGGGADVATLQPDTSATGTFSYDLAGATGWSGTRTFTLKLYQIGGSASGTSTTFDRLSIHSGAPWAQPATQFEHVWHPGALDFQASYPAGTASGFDVFHDEDAVTRVVRAKGLEGDGAGKLLLAGACRGTVRYDAGTRVVTVSSQHYTYAVALPRGAAVSFHASLAGLVFGAAGTEAPTERTGCWAAALPGTGDHAVGVGFAVDGDAAAAAAATERAGAACDVAGATADRASWTTYWDDYLTRVPAVQDFSVHTVDPVGVTAEQVRLQYYRAFLQLEQNLLPATPETGNMYVQVATGKASMWVSGSPGTRAVASWDALLGMQVQVHVNPEAAWGSFVGMMALVEADGKLGGESLPSRKAQTAWILYQATGDRARLEEVYGPLARHLRWEQQNMRWIYGSHDFPDERDAEFVISLIIDFDYAVLIAQELGLRDEVPGWTDLRQRTLSDYRGWFFPGPGVTLQKTFLEHSHPDEVGLTMYVATGLHIEGLPSAPLEELKKRFLNDYRPDEQFAGLAGEAIKAPDAQYMTYGLLDRGMVQEADALINALTRDMVRSGWFAEVYRQSGSLTQTPTADGVRPSLFGIANLIDNVWITNGYRLDRGTPAFIRMPGATGGVSGLTYRGKSLDVDIKGSVIRLGGEAAGLPGTCRVLDAPVGVTLDWSSACGGR